MGEDLYADLLKGLDEPSPVSIRLNPFKADGIRTTEIRRLLGVKSIEQVPWCSNGFYLSERPAFTFDPLLHAGVYYVQEASSMFLDFVIRQLVNEPVTMLDLCAAPAERPHVLCRHCPQVPRFSPTSL